MRRLSIVLSLPVLCAVSLCAQNAGPASLYTTLSGKNCRAVKRVEETGASVQMCGGAGRYALFVLDDDSRMSLTVLSPDKKEHPLDLWTVVTKSFSTLGPRAEWRVVKANGAVTPVALIVRVNANIQEDPDRPRRKSYLVVTKITAEETCVTDTVDASPNANARARQLADASARKNCLK
jgi:hypothetical protein